MNLEAWPIPENPATIKAKEIYYNFAIKRNEIKIQQEIFHKKWPEYLQCCRCSIKGNKRKYRSSEMLHVSSRTKRKETGKIEIHFRHYCPECQKTYKPNKKRAGGRNF